jgi:hypothetical protein
VGIVILATIEVPKEFVESSVLWGVSLYVDAWRINPKSRFVSKSASELNRD